MVWGLEILGGGILGGAIGGIGAKINKQNFWWGNSTKILPKGSHEIQEYAAKFISEQKFASKVSVQKQARHLKGTAGYNKGYLDSFDDAQKVLDAFNSGNYKLLQDIPGRSSVKIQVEGVFGTYVNQGNPNGLPDVFLKTSNFMIQSLKSPKVVPINPNFK